MQFAVLVVGDGEGQVAASSFDDGARCLYASSPFARPRRARDCGNYPASIYCRVY